MQPIDILFLALTAVLILACIYGTVQNVKQDRRLDELRRRHEQHFNEVVARIRNRNRLD